MDLHAKIFNPFEESGSIAYTKSETLCSATNENSFNVMLNLVENPHKSVRVRQVTWH